MTLSGIGGNWSITYLSGDGCVVLVQRSTLHFLSKQNHFFDQRTMTLFGIGGHWSITYLRCDGGVGLVARSTLNFLSK